MDLNKPYYPRNNDLNSSECLLLGKYGVKGYGVYSLLLQEINKSYYMKYNDEIGSMLAKRWGTSTGLVFDIVKDSLNWGIFSIKMFKEFGILTSAEIQINHFEAIKSRKNITIEKELLLSSVIPQLSKIAKYKSLFEEIFKDLDKEKKTKQDETKQDETKQDETKGEETKQAETGQPDEPSEITSLSFENFKNTYPEKCMGFEDYEPSIEINFDLLATKIEESPQFLKICNNLNLKWLTHPKNYLKVINDCYKDKDLKTITIISNKQSHNSKGRDYSPAELNSLFDSMEDFEV